MFNMDVQDNLIVAMIAKASTVFFVYEDYPYQLKFRDTVVNHNIIVTVFGLLIRRRLSLWLWVCLSFYSYGNLVVPGLL